MARLGYGAADAVRDLDRELLRLAPVVVLGTIMSILDTTILNRGDRAVAAVAAQRLRRER